MSYKEECQDLLQEMRNHMNLAYDIAGTLRDKFSHIKPEASQYIFKDPCNLIRGFIYEAQRSESKLRGHVNNGLKEK